MPNSEEMLRQALKIEDVRRLASEVAHDLNNMLTAIIGSSEILLKRLDDHSPLREKAELIRNAGKQAVLLTKKLLTLSKEGRDISDDATTAAQESQKAVGETVEGMQAIAEAAMKAQEVINTTDKQNHGMTEIAKAMAEINRITQEVKTAMVQQSSGAEQISKAVEEDK